MKTILLVIFTLAIEVCSFNHKIDLKRCPTSAKDATCFVRDSCIERKDSQGNVQHGVRDKLSRFPDAAFDKLNGTCGLIMQMKPLTSDKWHVMIEVKKESDDLKFSEGIKLMQKDKDQKDTLIFECKPDPQSEGKIMDTETRGDNQIYNSTTMFCSIIIKEKTSKEIPKIFEDYEGEPYLRYETDQGAQLIKYTESGPIFWGAPTQRCDPSQINSKETSDGLFLLHEIDTTLSEIKCDNESHKLMANYPDKKLDPTNKLWCSGVKYKADGQKELISKEFELEAYCAEEFCTLCPPLGYKQCQGCNPPEPKPDSKCKSVTCPSTGNKWRLADGSVVENPKIECNRSGTNSKTGGWFMTVDSKRTEIIEGSCSDKFDCSLFSSLNFSPLPPDCPSCKNALLSSDKQTISCPDGFELRFSSSNSFPKSAPNLTCNVATGHYVYNEKQAEKGDKMHCDKSPPPPSSAAKAGLGAGATAGIVVGVIIIILIVLFLIFLVLRRRKNEREQKTRPTSTCNDEVKTAIYARSNEPIDNRVTKSQSGSEAPPSTERPSKERMQSRGDEKEKDEKKEEKSNKEKKSTKEKKEEKSIEKKEESKEKKKAKVEKLPIKMEKKPVPNTLQIKKELEAQLREKREGIDTKEIGKRLDASDLDMDQLKFAGNPGSKLKRWDESDFKDLLLPDVHILKVHDRLTFLRNLSAFYYLTSPQNSDYGTIVQFFRVVKKSMDKRLDCPPSWEVLFRTIKLFCHHLPQKEGADVIKRMRTLMIDCARMMMKRLGFVRRMREDTNDHMLARAQAMRILLWAEDEICLEALKTAAEAKPEEVDPHLQAVVFSYAVNKMGKKDELEARYKEEIKTGMEYPHEFDEKEKAEVKPFGTLRQHLIFALCSNKDSAAMEEFLRGLTDYNPTDLSIAFLGATEHVANFEKTLTIFADKEVPLDEIFPAVLDKFTKSDYERDYVKKKMKEDLDEMCYATGWNCISHAQFFKWNMQAQNFYYYDPKQGSSFDSKAIQERAKNLDKMFKDIECIKYIEEGLKRINY